MRVKCDGQEWFITFSPKFNRKQTVEQSFCHCDRIRWQVICIRMADISLSDEYVLLLNDIINENKALGEKITQSSQADQGTLSDLANRIENLIVKVSSISEKMRR